MKKRKGLVLGGILLLGIGFASVSTTLYINGNVNISENTEDFNVVFTKAVVDSVDESSTAISEDGKTINYTTKELQALNDKSVLDFEITNNSSLYDAEVSIVCSSGERGEYYQITKEVAPTVLAKTTEAGKVEVEKIKATTEDIEEAFTCTLNAVALERTTKKEEIKNQNIEKAYVYDATSCITGEEPGCVETTCYDDKTSNSCTPGTIIKYRVNNSDSKYFHVLHDDGVKMTLQQRENTIDNVAWYSESQDNTKGPLTALETLENATNNWNNVNTINYKMGTTVFKDNSYTGCGFTSCTINQYQLERRTAKARMITIQETSSLGCTKTNGSCPVWLYNHLEDLAYWTMSAGATANDYAWVVHHFGSVNGSATNVTNFGARAVIEISKLT